MFTRTYEPRYGDNKGDGTLKISSLLDMVQDAAIRHSDECGYGFDVLNTLNFAWLVHGIKAHFEKGISPIDAITVTTGVKNMRGLTSERCCELSQNGRVIGKTIANWFLFDTAAEKPCKIPEEILSAYPIWELRDDFFSYKKPKLYEDAELFDSVRVSNKEIDTNLHLNNCKSAELLMDALPFEFSFTDMSILYKKAAYLGDEFRLCRKKIENGYYAHLATGDGEICVAATFEE
ncbi:MAG: hypothetical protein IJO61_05685 [Oscillospiraceae bacterium]|nr:hypothetical protein [Oscillospiraceae bacterium]